MIGTSSSDNHLCVDEFYFSALHDKEELFPISDEIYAEELELQEVLMSSAISSSRVLMNNESTKLELDCSYDCTTPNPHQTLKGKEKETGESSSPSFCVICMDAKPMQEMFTNNQCSHSFCVDCTANYVASKIQENISMVKCPDVNCKGVLEPQNCRSFVPKQVCDRWEDVLSESLILGSQKFYCPFKDCSAMLVDDGGEVVTVSECPNCHRLFCANCKVPWHEGMGCGEFQKLRKGEREREDIMLMELAKNKKWRRCPNCKFYVELVQGCVHISCRCGFHFCYGCGSSWSSDHQCPQT